MLVKDFMTPNPVTVTPDKMANETLDLMRSLNFRQCPVVEDGKLVGIVTDRDIRASRESGVKVGDIMARVYAGAFTEQELRDISNF